MNNIIILCTEEVTWKEINNHNNENQSSVLYTIAHDHNYLSSSSPDSSGLSNIYPRQNCCALCGKTLSNESNLKKHMDDCHNENKTFQCEICDKRFVREAQLASHLMSHSESRIYSCPVCSKTFVRADTLKRHMRVHSEDRPFKCMFCDREFKFRTPWKMHEATHSDDQPFECIDCGVKFSLSAALKEHKQEASCASHPFNCTHCQLEFSRRMDYLRHLNQLHGGKLVQKDFTCIYCSKSFIYQSLLRVHERRHTGEEPYQCHKCSRTFAHCYQLRTHSCTQDSNRNVLPYQKHFSCSLCSYQSISKRAMGLHVRSHSEALFCCELCGKKFVHRDKWSKHGEMCQKDVGTSIPCLSCPMTFSSSTAQKIHKNRVHKDFTATAVTCQRHFVLGQDEERRRPCHPCQVCGKCFSEKGVLNKHYRVHTGERPYQCQFCGNRFTSPSALHNHERTHTGERPHQCALCDKRFAQRTTLVEHMRRHTKDMPHKCSLCSRGFMVPSLLRKHQQTHLRNKEPNSSLLF